MYGLINMLRAKPGQRDALAEIIRGGARDLPGCRSYIVAKDANEPDVLWVTEVWDDEASHAASLQLPQVRAAIEQGRPLVEGMPEQHATEPLD